MRFDYTIKYLHPKGEMVKHADVELSEVNGRWKVVRLGLTREETPAAATTRN